MMNKDPQSSVFSSRSRGAFGIALLYLLIGILWIVFSDEAAAKLAPNQAILTQISIYKGWGYVFVTALLLYWMLSLYTKRLSRAEWTLGESEKNYQELLQQASDGIFIADAQGQYTLVNEEGCRLLGYTQAELLSMNLRELIAPEDIQKTPPRLDELKNGKTLLSERILLRKDGSRILCEISAKQFPDGRYQSIIRDITERKVTDEALLRSEQRYRSLFENMSNGFARCQMLYDESGAPKDFIYLDVNQTFEKMTGLKNVLGKRVSVVIPGIRASNPELFEIYGRVALTGKPEKFESYIPGLGSGIWFSTSVYSTEKNFFVAVFETITERKQAETALRENEERLRLSLHAANQGLYDLNVQTGNAIVNREYAEMLGYDFDTFVETNAAWIERLHPDDRELTANVYADYIKGLTPEYRVEFRQKTKAGDWKWILSVGKVVEFDTAGNPLRMLGTHTDITARKQAELDLKDMLVNLQDAEEQARLGSWYFDVKAEKGWWSPQMYKLFSQTPTMGIPTNEKYFEMIHPDDRSILVATMSQMAQGLEPERKEFRTNPARGEMRILSPQYRVEKNQAGEVVKFFGTALDITERMHQVEALKESEAKYRTLHDSMIDGFVSVDVHGNFLECNEVYRNMLGYSDAELAGLTYIDITPENWHAYETDIVENQILKRGFSDVYEKEYRRKDGTIFPVELHTVLLRDEAGTPSGMWAIVRDITERKHIEEVIKESEEKFRNVFEFSPLGKSLTSIDGNLRVNKSFCRIVGYSEEELKIKHWKEITHPDDIQKSMDVIQSLLDNKTSNAHFEKRYIHKNGKLVWTDVVTALQRDKNGQPLYFLTTINDITERKQAEEKILDSELRYRRLFESAKDGILILDAETGLIVDVNPFLTTLLDYPYEYFLGKRLWELGFFKDIVANAENFQELLQKKYIRYEDLPLESANGKRMNVEFVSNVYQVDHHKVIQCNIRDITERKHAELALQAAEYKYRMLAENSPDTIYIIDLKTFKTVYLNRPTLLGYTLDELEASGSIMSKVHPDDIVVVQQHWQDILKGTGKESVEYRLQLKEGSWEWLSSRENLLDQDENGSPTQVLVTLSVITERKQAEAALREREQKLKTILNLLPVGVSILDQDRKVVYSNDTLGKILETTQEGLLRGDYRSRKYVRADGSEKPVEEFASTRIFTEHTELHDIVTGVAKEDGYIIWTSVSAVPVDFLDWKVVLVTADITERKHIQEALRDNEERFRATFEQAAVGIAHLSPAGSWLRVNQKLCDIVGYSHTELLTKTFQDITHPEDLETDLNYVRQILADEIKTYSMEKRYIRKNGSQVWIDLTVALVRDEAGQPKYFISVIEDITERKHAEEELKRSNAELEQFAYVASHDLQEPLRAVAGMVQLLGQRYQGKLDERADEYIGHAVEASTRMQKLINDLLDYSRVNRLGRSFENTAVEKSLNTALANLQLVIQESQAQITHDPLPSLMTDSGQLTQVLQNLIGNAIKFRGARPLHIHIGAKKIEGAWQFEVSDNGIGIESKYYERIFLVFQRLHTRREYPGTGIGLALCKKIIERHNGQIWVESQPGLGSTFYFTIPER